MGREGCSPYCIEAEARVVHIAFSPYCFFPQCRGSGTTMPLRPSFPMSWAEVTAMRTFHTIDRNDLTFHFVAFVTWRHYNFKARGVNLILNLRNSNAGVTGIGLSRKKQINLWPTHDARQNRKPFAVPTLTNEATSTETNTQSF